ncbi:MAG TPA: hypothetical protein VE596_01715 [Gaiellaceae bacterium]|jgi:hypothetical protein|nr:hypothetical protein [Gaiellaceae bacterium]
MVVAMIVICCAPWLVSIGWIVHRHGLRVLFPQNDVPVSFADLQRRSTVS